MYVENVHLYNIDRLFNICAFVLEQKDMVGKTFEKNLTEIYNQMSVTFKISTLSFMEYFHMKYMLEDGAVEKMEPVFSMSYVNTVYPEISSTVRQLHRMMNTGFENVILPACFSGITTVTISGRDLYMIFKSDPMREFFVKVIPEDKLYDEDHKFNVNVIDEMFKNGLITDANIEEMFANTFLTNFYTSMMRNHEYVDILSDFSMQQFYTNKTIELVSVNNFNATTKDFITNLQSLNKDIYDVMDGVKLTFSCETDFNTFMQIYNILPKRCFGGMESLRIPHSFLQNEYGMCCVNDEKTNKILETLRVNINDSYGIKGKELQYASLIPANGRYHYIIQISLRDINSYVESLKNIEIGLYTNEIYSTIMKYGKLVYGVVKK